MYIHYCKYCQRIHILNGHKYYCPRCRGHLAELKISYMKYVSLDRSQRNELRVRLSDPAQLSADTAVPKKFRFGPSPDAGDVSLHEGRSARCFV